MTRRIIVGLVFLLIAFFGLWTINYLALFGFSLTNSGKATPLISNLLDSPKESEPESVADEVPFSTEVVVQGLTVPWAIIFTGPNRMLISERTGAIREYSDGLLNPDPLITFADTARGGEIGLMGLAIDPEYSSNKLIYACVGYKTGDGYADRVVQLRDNGNTLTQEKVVLDQIPAGSNHAGCELAFGPDGKLYISTGDATERNIAQDLSSLGGKLLRINSDGSIPADNPFSNSAIYSYGHRNPQGFDWTTDGSLYEAEHGPSGNDGPGGGDEINLIKPAANYGWPLVSHDRTREGTLAPLITYTPAIAPSSLLIYKGDVFPQFRNTALVAALRGQGIYWVQFDSSDPTIVANSKKLNEIDVGRVREITQGPDGLIYFTSSNTDGRGRPAEGDDKIYRFFVADR